MSLATILVITRKELRDARRSRWLLLIAGTFAVLALALSALGMAGLGRLGIAGFGRTTASLLNLVVLIVPLMGLLLGTMSIAAEREHGSLLLLLAQPVTRAEVFTGKLLGLAAALALAVVIGFGLSGVVIARYSGWQQVGDYLGMAGLTLLLGLVYLAIGLWISAGTHRYITALGLAVFLWLAVVFLSDLGVMGTAMVLRLKPGHVLWLALGNPTQVFKLAVLQAVHGHLESAGSAGLYAVSVFGGWLLPLLVSFLLAWIVVPLGVAAAVFHRRGAG